MRWFQNASWLGMLFVGSLVGCNSSEGPPGQSPPSGLDGGDGTPSGDAGDSSQDPNASRPDPAPCEPVTCAAQGKDCGYIRDGCGEFIECGTCEAPEYCSAQVANECGTGTGSGVVCEGGLCEHRADCDGAGEAPTTLRGTVYAPDGVTPLSNAVVYVPNDADPNNLPPIVDGASCERCEDEDLGDPITGAITQPNGSFALRNVPAGVPFPLVVKAGKWRRVVMVSAMDACSSRTLPAADTRLPRNQSEGHIPRIAVSTGQVDALECVLYKLGVDEGEFTRPSGTGRVHLYRSNGAWADAALRDTCSGCTNASCDTFITLEFPFFGEYPAVCRQQLTRNLYGDQARLDSYDLAFFGCDYPLDGSTRSDQWTGQDHQRIRDYGDKGGRLFLSHFNYEWLSRSQAPQELRNLADYSGGHSVGLSDPSAAWVDTSFGRGVAFLQWLEHVGATHANPSQGHLLIHEPRTHIRSVNAPAQRWAYTTQANHGRDSVQSFTFDMPADGPRDQTCGRGVYSAFHVVGGDAGGFFGGGEVANSAFPEHCPSGNLTPQELALVFMMFDLAACVTEGDRPPPGVCIPESCEELGAQCGTTVDNCGRLTQCGECPSGELCSPATNTCTLVH
jgi:hypothetical protein